MQNKTLGSFRAKTIIYIYIKHTDCSCMDVNKKNIWYFDLKINRRHLKQVRRFNPVNLYYLTHVKIFPHPRLYAPRKNFIS